jgi:hypothetical protein
MYSTSAYYKASKTTLIIIIIIINMLYKITMKMQRCMSERALLEKLTVSQLVKKFPASYETG